MTTVLVRASTTGSRCQDKAKRSTLSLNVDGERVHAKGYTTDLLTDYVERFMDRPSDRPFLVYLAHKAIHPNRGSA